MENPVTSGPREIELEPGKTYSWCRCGQSKTQPLCDEVSHKTTGFEPRRFSVSTKRKVWLCMCKQTKSAPYCDGTHNTLRK
ncbi:CDGSH iron-sulfur domain-containing protein [Chryseolinea serpens]|uniref:CDGSH iron-sulfur domain-containing protein n=1 Tax=Chryseolinea serpens TaxID=947013 RepID=UPI000932BA3A|nr:CDGSH iron-sulfur domain-containing protein [Chryseolinea serpens]